MVCCEAPRRAGRTSLQMRQKLLSIGDDFWIEDEAGNRAYRVEARPRDCARRSCSRTRKVARWRRSRSAAQLRDKMVIERDGGRLRPSTRRWIGIREPFRDRRRRRRRPEAHGNIVDHEYKSSGRRDDRAVSKKWFRVRDTYGSNSGPARTRPAAGGRRHARGRSRTREGVDTTTPP